MKKKNSTKKPLVSKADLDKINDAVNRTVTTIDMYKSVFLHEQCTLSNQIRVMVTEEIRTDEETARRLCGRKITKTLNEMFELFVKHEDNVATMFSEADEGLAVITLLKFADKVGMIRLLHVPKLDSKSSANTISFKVYIANMQVCWCRIRTRSRKGGTAVLTRFTN